MNWFGKTRSGKYTVEWSTDGNNSEIHPSDISSIPPRIREMIANSMLRSLADDGNLSVEVRLRRDLS